MTDATIAYVCRRCNKRYSYPNPRPAIACAVNHPPGTCCHNRETEICQHKIPLTERCLDCLLQA